MAKKKKKKKKKSTIEIGKRIAATRAQRRVINRQLAETCRQLGFESHKAAEYGPAVRYLREAFTAEPSPATAAHLAQSASRWIIALGRPGTEPILRTDPYRTPTCQGV